MTEKSPVIAEISPVVNNVDEVMNPRPHLDELAYLSNMIWSYKKFAGSLVPWHDKSKEKWVYDPQLKALRRFFYKMEELDVDWRAYCTLAFPLSSYQDYVTVTKLISQKTSHWSWIKLLRTHTGSREEINRISNFLWKFFALQVKHQGDILLFKKNVVASNPVEGHKRKYYELYHQLYDRIKNIQHYGVDIDLWLEQKFINFVTAYPDGKMQLRTIVNKNGLDPDLAELQRIQNDPWRAIRSYLGLSHECQFPDGCIPKGWVPVSQDYEDPLKIVQVTKNGFYFYADGSQRRGTRHYLSNTYLTILCNPDNFEEFKEKWKDPAYITKMPTWEEYSKYALHSGFWDETGMILKGNGKSINWRKRP